MGQCMHRIVSFINKKGVVKSNVDPVSRTLNKKVLKID